MVLVGRRVAIRAVAMASVSCACRLRASSTPASLSESASFFLLHSFHLLSLFSSSSPHGVQKHQASVAAALAELGVARPPISTVKVNEKFNSLKDCLVVLFELQKVCLSLPFSLRFLSSPP